MDYLAAVLTLQYIRAVELNHVSAVPCDAAWREAYHVAAEIERKFYLSGEVGFVV